MWPHCAPQSEYTLLHPLEVYQKPLKYGYPHTTDRQHWFDPTVSALDGLNCHLQHFFPYELALNFHVLSSAHKEHSNGTYLAKLLSKFGTTFAEMTVLITAGSF